ncbi:hypothetical protein [Cellulomonas xiejunii]|uniref:Uncharacterized protein n=1 Tax=Cellulomonas xiejunii TaxID=2968083 RepID=A0ABY5KM84_9CELL|nr:hypothetical protein [Cellulomonas xiejunii]MCC2323456.1 hypothetical protein [Cellulomonas xiejunii]UUI71614.1 hypothetical protein NP048_17770 [Cellulomonas xiejunii]
MGATAQAAPPLISEQKIVARVDQSVFGARGQTEQLLTLFASIPDSVLGGAAAALGAAILGITAVKEAWT